MAHKSKHKRGEFFADSIIGVSKDHHTVRVARSDGDETGHEVLVINNITAIKTLGVRPFELAVSLADMMNKAKKE